MRRSLLGYDNVPHLLLGTRPAGAVRSRRAAFLEAQPNSVIVEPFASDIHLDLSHLLFFSV
jgi:hypothetical protein